MGEQEFRKSDNRGDFGDGGSVQSKTTRHGCFGMVKEYKSRFYIVRRCVRLLICWHKDDKY
uniref:Uncharacterized protein n=1 Tax=Cajanus cajan TaxID=3821 RepID=A0A151THV7_CAJCA|nr:hypothetical protein KK1_012946 [Cajanus cajan]